MPGVCVHVLLFSWCCFPLTYLSVAAAQVSVCAWNGPGERVGRGGRHRGGQPKKLSGLVSF